MKPSKFLKLIARGFVAAAMLSQPLKAEPVETPIRTFERTIDSGSVVDSTLTKNIYRQEAYQEEYVEQVPYQEDETYYEDVPYQEEETYTDYEEYQDQEYQCQTVNDQQCSDQQVCQNVPVCHDVQECRDEQVCRAVPDRQCHNEHICQPVPGDNHCEMVQECGNNAQGQRICKDRKVCHQDPDRQNCSDVQRCEDTTRQECSNQRQCATRQACEDRQQCSTNRVCRDVPRQQCAYVPVTKTRPVQRTRTVTKYRQEERTRTVTKYRDETRCCRTAYRDVFDHQDTIQIAVRFPQNTVLKPNEKEVLQATYIQGATADADLQIVSSIYGYQVANKSVQGDTVVFDLGLVAKYSADQVGEKTIDSVKLEVGKQASKLTIVDNAAFPRISTKYSYQIKSADGTVLAKGASIAEEQKNVVIAVSQSPPLDKDLTIEVQVERSGLVLADKVLFTKSAKYLFSRLNSQDFAEQTLKSLDATEQAQMIQMQFTDLGADERLETKYSLTLVQLDGNKTVFSKAATVQDLDKDKTAHFTMPTALLTDKKKYTLNLKVTRESALLDKPVAFIKSKSFTYTFDTAPFMGDDKVSGLVLKGAGSKLSLNFTDTAPKNPDVVQIYQVVVNAKSGLFGTGRKTLVDAKVNRDHIQMNNDSQIQINLLNDLSANKDLLEKYAKTGKKLMVDLIVTRQSPRMNDGKAIVIKKSMALEI